MHKYKRLTGHHWIFAIQFAARPAEIILCFPFHKGLEFNSLLSNKTLNIHPNDKSVDILMYYYRRLTVRSFMANAFFQNVSVLKRTTNATCDIRRVKEMCSKTL
jgi:hypothetical protein